MNIQPLNLLLPGEPGFIGKRGRDKTEQKLFDQGSINNSRLTDIARLFRGEALFTGNESYLGVGTEIHKRRLEEHLPIKHMGKDEPVVQGCVTSLQRCKALTAHLTDAEVEQFVWGLVFGHLMHGTIDLMKGKKGGDIKTTSTTSLLEFIYSMVKYGYFRQALVYMILANLDTFIFYAVQKRPPYKVFVVDVSKFPNEMRQAENELKFLLYYYKTYGIPA
jgi:hypothetical protein